LIATGHSHSGCISETAPARLYTWGANSDHRLMTEDSESRFTPSLTVLEKMKDRLESNEPWSLSLGVTHSAVVTRSGEVITGGSKIDG
jgi:alpha-tubulin suppressor-like RCC1 family protein